MTFRVTLHNSS